MASWNQKGSSLIKRLSLESAQKSLTLVEREFINLATGVIEDTPIGLGPEGDGDGGRLRANWQIAKSLNERVLKQPNKTKGRSFAEQKIRGVFSNAKLNKNISLFIFNNSPYAGAVEFGGYPDEVKRGTYNSKTKSYEIRSIAGFSRQAPVGMMRLNVLNYKNRIRRLL